MGRLLFNTGVSAIVAGLLFAAPGSARDIGDVAVIYDWGWTQYGVAVDTTPSVTLVNSSLGLWLDPAAMPAGEIGGFDFLLCAVTGGMELLYVEPGPDLSPDWEYFTYRKGPAAGGCVDACDGIQIRVRGVANLTDGIDPSPAKYQLSGCIARLVFTVSGDWSFLGQCLRVGFCSADCQDNVLYSRGGDTLYIVTTGFAAEEGFDPLSCAGMLPGATVVPSFVASPGYICVREPSSPGDMNLNGLAKEAGDFVLFSNFMKYGGVVWTPPYEAVQTQESDFNEDGKILTPADLFVLRWYITGNWLQFPLQFQYQW